MRKTTTISLSGRNLLRLKINAAKSGTSVSGLIVRMLDQQFPATTAESLTLIDAANAEEMEGMNVNSTIRP